MGNTTYTNNYQLKLIGTGREAGTWGESANENFARIEAAIGKAVSINLQSMPTGSTSANVGNSWTAIWLTVDTADELSSQSGSEGRSAVVEVTSSGTLDPDPQLNIRGASSGEVPYRVLFIKNALGVGDEYPLIINGGGADEVIIPHGSWAIVAIMADSVGTLGQGAINLLDGINLGGITFNDDTTLVLSGGSNVIDVPVSEAAALTITDGTDAFLRIDTVDTVIDVLQNLSFVDKGDASLITLPDALAAALDIEDASNNSFIKIDTDTPLVTIGQNLSLESSTINSIAQTTAWTIIDDEDSALSIAPTGMSNYLVFKTTNGDERVQTAALLEAPDLFLNGTNAYILFQTNEAVPADNYGIRNNLGRVQIKSSGGSWGDVITSSMTSGNGSFFESTVNLGDQPTLLMADTFSASENHLLGSVPKMVRGVLRCMSADLSYSVGDEISLDSIAAFDGGGSPSNRDSITYGANSTQVFVHVNNITELGISTSGTGTPTASIDRAKWDLYIYAWK